MIHQIAPLVEERYAITFQSDWIYDFNLAQQHKSHSYFLQTSFKSCSVYHVSYILETTLNLLCNEHKSV